MICSKSSSSATTKKTEERLFTGVVAVFFVVIGREPMSEKPKVSSLHYEEGSKTKTEERLFTGAVAVFFVVIGRHINTWPGIAELSGQVCVAENEVLGMLLVTQKHGYRGSDDNKISDVT